MNIKYVSDYELVKSADDIGYDIRSVEETVIKPNEVKMIDSGLKLELNDNLYVDVRGRSGMNKKGIWCATGLVDTGYRGNIGVILANFSGKDFEVKVGDRIAQIVFRQETLLETIKVENIDEETDRGAKGFGSSGLN